MHVVEFGPGQHKRNAAAIGVDVQPGPGVDVVMDAIEFLRGQPTGSIERIESYHFLEHLPDVATFMRECGRVLTDDGSMRCVVPHFSNPYYYSDPTHIRPFGLYTMSYFAHDRVLGRDVPSYVRVDGLDVVDVRLGFQAEDRVGTLLRRPLTVLGRSPRLAKLYERNLTWLIPCYEVRYELVRRPRSPVG